MSSLRKKSQSNSPDRGKITSKPNSSLKKTKSRSSVDSDVDESHLSKRSNKNKSPLKKKSPSKSPTKRATKNSSKSPMKLNHAEVEDLTNQGMASLPPHVFDKTRLRELYLSGNNLRGLPPQIRELVYLETLDVSKNPLKVKDTDDITCFPLEIRYLKNLKYLNISECNLRYIPSPIWLIVSLEHLNISRNKITMLVSEIGNLSNLMKLNLTQCDIATLPAEIGFCENLEEILLWGNHVESLPETLKECRKLSKLKINYHSFHALLDIYMAGLIQKGSIKSEHIPMVVFELESLTSLDLSSTKINNFPENNLKSLQELRLDNNYFDRIPEEIFRGDKALTLTSLSISKNHLTSVPAEISSLVNLRELNLSSNSIFIFPDSAKLNLTNLSELYLTQNGLNQLTSEIACFKNLKRLALDHNRLVTLPIELFELNKLEFLDLSHNNLTKLSHKITKLSNLKMAHVYNKFSKTGLWLTNNPLSSPPKDIWITNDINKIFDYIRTSHQRNVNYCYFSKLLFIGESNAGKSCIVDFLVNPINIKNFLPHRRPAHNSLQSVAKTNHISTPLSRLQTNQTSDNIQMITPLSTRTSTNLINDRPESTSTRVMRKFYLRTADKIDFGLFDLGGDPSYHHLYPHLFASIDHSTQPAIFVIVFSHSEYSTQTHERLIGMWLKYVLLYSRNCDGVPIKVKLVGIKAETLLDEVSYDSNISKQIHDKCNHSLNLHKIQLSKEKARLEECLKQGENAFEVAETIKRLNEEISKKIKIIEEISYIDSDTIKDDISKLLKSIQNETILANKKAPLTLRNQTKKFVLNQDKTKFKLDKSYIEKLIDDNRDDILDSFDMENDEILDYLYTIGDIFWFKTIPCLSEFIFNRPGFLVECLKLIIRHDLDIKLDYTKNLVYKKLGLYKTQEDYDLDLQLFKKYGIFVNKILDGLVFENDLKKQTKEQLLDLLQDLIIVYKCSTEFDDRNLPVQKCVYPNVITAEFKEDDHESSRHSEFDKIIMYKEETYFMELDKYREYVNIVKLIKAERKEQEIWNLNQYNSYDTANEEENEKKNETLRKSVSAKLRDTINVVHEKVVDESVREQDQSLMDTTYTSKERDDNEFIINSIENEFKHIKSYHDVKLDMIKYTHVYCARHEYTFLFDYDVNIFNKLSILVQELIYERLDSSTCILARDRENNFIKIENQSSLNSLTIQFKCLNHDSYDYLSTKFNRFFQTIFAFYPGFIYLKKIILN